MKKLILLLFSIVFSVSAIAQDRSVSGVVTDAQSGDPIPGVAVVVVGTNIGVATDNEGEYSLRVPEGRTTLQFSFVGYRTLTEQIGGRSEVNVVMRLDLALLDEIVVSGYSAIPQRELTGSMSTVRGRDVQALDIVSPDQALQGRVSGSRVANLSGQPGGSTYIRVRGIGSINAGNAPLYIVDGVPISSVDRSGTLGSSSASNALNAINPRDIQSIEVLKDAAASAIYGAQAANGVILITTRRGTAGDTQFNLSANFGIAEEMNRLDIIEGPEWVELQYEAWDTWGEFNNRTDGPALAPGFIGGWTLQDVADGNVPHYDWQDAMMRTGTTQRYDLSASGGDERTRFFVSGGYNNTQGVAIATDMQRMNIRANIDHRANDRISFDFNVSASLTEQNGALQEGFFLGSPFFMAQFIRPTNPIFNEDGTYATEQLFNYNPLAANELDDRNSTQKQLIGSVGAIYNITNNLNFRTNWGLDYRTTEDIDYRAPESPAGESLGGYRFDANRNVTNFTTNQVFNYYNTFAEVHGVRALGGFEYRQETRETFSASGQGFPSGLFRTLQNAAEPLSVTGFGSEYRQASFFSRVQYDYDDTYLTNVSVRYDGNSRFGEDKRWGLFYAGSLAWRASNMSFMDFSNDWLEDLKFRISYGITGNSAISNFASRQLFVSGGAYNNNPALTPGGLGNNLLTWEESATINLGVDWAVLESRVYGSVDVYSRENSKLLLDRDLPSDSGFSSLTENVGRVQNQGLEIELGAILVDRGGLVWTSEVNMTWQRNELLELSEGDDRQGNLFVGRPLTEYYMYRYAGVNPADGRGMFYDRNGNITYTPSTASDVADDDRQFVGDTQPGSFGGWFNRFNYRGFQLDFLFQGNFGQSSYNSFTGSFTDGAFFRRAGLIGNSRNRWTEPGQITSVERPYVNSSYPGRTGTFITSTKYLENAGYIRLKNVQIAYNLPVSLTEQIGIRNARVFAQATNLLTWTAYNGIDPEIVGTNNAIYPQSRTLTTGIEIGF